MLRLSLSGNGLTGPLPEGLKPFINPHWLSPPGNGESLCAEMTARECHGLLIHTTAKCTISSSFLTGK